MKKLFTLFIGVFALCACERTDVRTQAANIIYKRCSESGAGKLWCRCLRADLIDSTKQFTEEMATDALQNRHNPWLATAIAGARLRCQCRMSPQRVAAYGLSCTGVKTIKF